MFTQSNKKQQNRIKKAVSSTLVFFAVSLTSQQAFALPEGSIDLGHVTVNAEWYNEVKDDYDYSALNGAEALIDKVLALLNAAEGFTPLSSYCKPPQVPNKKRHRRILDDYMRLYEKHGAEYSNLQGLSDMAAGSAQKAAYATAERMLTEYARDLYQAFLAIEKAKQALAAAPEIDCNTTAQNANAGLRSNQDLLAALQNAQGQNPYNNTREIALPYQEEVSTDVLYEAQRANRARRADIEFGRKWRQRHPEKGRHLRSTPRTREDAPTATAAQDGREYSSDSSQNNNQPILRETGDSTGIFQTRSPTNSPILRETGDNTGIFRDLRNIRSANLDRGTTNATEVPQLVDVPTVGRLFRNKDENRRESELLILVTPTIVETEE